ncbi:MAG: CHAT domain-containing protein, partial [Blastocatellia bacterium]|nr:CHAT domain-containing protein [Blastocatellia bacterium]
LAAVQAMLPAGTALIEFVLYTPQEIPTLKSLPARYLAYLLTPHGPPRWVDLGEAAAIDRGVEAWRRSLRGNRIDVKRLARELDEKIMRSVRSSLQPEINHLLIAPDGMLNLIPFAALVDEENRYLIERFNISYLTSGRDLLRLQNSPPSREAPLVLADPRFDEGPPMLAQAFQRSPNSAQPRQLGQSGQSGQSGQIYFRPLPGTKAEALAIKALMPDASLLLQEQATEAALKRARAPRILHIATHGFFLNDHQIKQTEAGAEDETNAEPRLGRQTAQAQGSLWRSGLALSDGILTALEMAGLDLWGTRLVVLSACDTGLGEVRNGEGVQGLRRALVLAGSESQVMSLWPVTDEGAREFMIDYYKALQRGEGRGEGLRQVQLRMLHSKERRHPFYWATFIQSGEWANLDGKR